MRQSLSASWLFYFFGHDYQKDRIRAWIYPEDYKKTIGYQITQSLIAIGSGGVWGQGMGTGISKFSYLPEAHTDFAYAISARNGAFWAVSWSYSCFSP